MHGCVLEQRLQREHAKLVVGARRRRHRPRIDAGRRRYISRVHVVDQPEHRTARRERDIGRSGIVCDLADLDAEVVRIEQLGCLHACDDADQIVGNRADLHPQEENAGPRGIFCDRVELREIFGLRLIQRILEVALQPVRKRDQLVRVRRGDSFVGRRRRVRYEVARRGERVFCVHMSGLATRLAAGFCGSHSGPRRPFTIITSA